MRLWFDLDNPPDVNVFCSIIRSLRDHECIVTTRRFDGLDRLLDMHRLVHRVIGGHLGSAPLAKGVGTAARTIELALRLPIFDASIASLGVPSVLAARLRGRPAIGFLDGDLPTANFRASAPLVSHLFVPSVFNDHVLDRFGLTERATKYEGFKEELAVANYEPNPTFLEEVPFQEYVLVRPEALRAEYVPRGATSIVPELLKRFEDEDINVLYLPRYLDDRLYAEGRKNVFIPAGPVNGLDASYYARAVLTGSGTFAREAAVLGVPAASFFPGPTLLSVDLEMIRRSWIIHSRIPDVLVDYALTAPRRPFDRAGCRRVLQQVLSLLDTALSELVAE